MLMVVQVCRLGALTSSEMGVSHMKRALKVVRVAGTMTMPMAICQLQEGRQGGRDISARGWQRFLVLLLRHVQAHGVLAGRRAGRQASRT